MASTTTPSKINPLDLPELRYLLASYLQNHHPPHYQNHHHPSLLATCALVCRSWYQTFNPLLWRTLPASRLLSTGRLNPKSLASHASLIHHLRAGKLDKARYQLESCTDLRTLILEDERVSDGESLVWAMEQHRLEVLVGGVAGGIGPAVSLLLKDEWFEQLEGLIRRNRGNLSKIGLMMDRFQPRVGFWEVVKLEAKGLRELECLFTRIPRTYFEPFLGALGNLETLVLQHCAFDRPVMAALAPGEGGVVVEGFDPEAILRRERQEKGGFPRLKFLTLATNTGMELPCQLGFIRLFPNLTSLSWSILGAQPIPIQEFCQLLNQDCPHIESLKISDRNLEAGPLARILRAVPRLKKFYLRFDGSDSLMNDPEVIEAMLGKHGPTLTEVEFGQIHSQIDGATVLGFLQQCPNLKSLVAYGRLDCRRLISTPSPLPPPPLPTEVEHSTPTSPPPTLPSPPPSHPLLQDTTPPAFMGDRPWVCLGLKKLHVIMAGGQDPNVWLNRSIHLQLFRQLGRLTELRSLSLGHCILWMYEQGFTSLHSQSSMNHPHHHHHRQGLDFRVHAGLGQLGGLQKLEELNIEGIHQQMSERDVEWILKHWPALRVIEGELHYRKEDRERLDRMMEERGFRVASHQSYRRASI